jgi:ABC-type uncharacterized transport system substrate-binding protein
VWLATVSKLNYQEVDPVAVIVATGITAVRAAKVATTTIPIVFNTGGDLARFGQPDL